MANIGRIKQIIGPVVDVSFAESGSKLPEILNALVIKRADGTELVLECQRHLGQDSVRAVAMDATDGLGVAVCHHFSKGIGEHNKTGGNSWSSFVKNNPERKV